MCGNDLIPQQIENNFNDAGGSPLSLTGCDVGSRNQIRFNPNTIEGGDLVIVQYNSSASPQQQWIEVK